MVSILFPSSFTAEKQSREMCSQAAEKVHLVQCLPCKHKELSLISRAHVRNVRGVSLGSMYSAGVGTGETRVFIGLAG